MKKYIALFLAILFICATSMLTSCDYYREADKVNKNLSLAADYFNCERKITVYNARTDKIILEITGFMSLSNNTTRELVVTCKVGENEYKKNYVYLNEYTLYVVEDITGTHTDPYHYNVIFHTDVLPVNIEVTE